MGHVGLIIRNTLLTFGEDYFVHSFFSTIAYRVEREGWGSRFPALMNELYQGRLPHDRVAQARAELEQVQEAFGQLPPEARIFAYEDPNRPTPWPVPPGAQTLADCFISTHGTNVLVLVEEALDMSDEGGADVEIQALNQPGTDTYYVTGER